MGKNSGPSSNSISPYCFPPVLCPPRHPSRADAGSRTSPHPHGKRTTPHVAHQRRLLDGAPQPRLLDSVPQPRHQTQTNHKKTRRNNAPAHNPKGGGSTARTAKAWRKMRPSLSQHSSPSPTRRWCSRETRHAARVP